MGLAYVAPYDRSEHDHPVQSLVAAVESVPLTDRVSRYRLQDIYRDFDVAYARV